MTLTRKQKVVLLFGFIVIVVAVVLIVIFTKRGRSSDHHGSGPGGCGDAYEKCNSNSDCCNKLSCKDGTCLYTTISDPIAAFQMVTSDNKCIVLDKTSRTLTLGTDCNWEKSWWSWDGAYIRFLTDDGTVYGVGDPVNKGSVLLTATPSDKVILINHDGVGGLQSKTFQYCIILHNDVLMWSRCVDIPSGTGIVFKIQAVPKSKCKSPGESCSVNDQCCAPYHNCQNNICRACPGPIPECHTDSDEPNCNQYTGKWSCVSKCVLTDKDKAAKKCKSNEQISCQLSCPEGKDDCKDSEKNWNWTCISECDQKQKPSTCPQSTCQQNKDNTWSYKCDLTCDQKAMSADPPEAPSGCKKIDDDECVGSETGKVCYKCGPDSNPVYKKQYYDCDNTKWSLEDVCDAKNKPVSCPGGEDPICIRREKEFCDGKEGLQWICPSSTDDWCGFASYHRLAPLSRVCLPGDSVCQETVYTTPAGVPVYPTVSYDHCSVGSINTIKFDEDKSQNPKGFLQDHGDNHYTLYPSDKSTTIDGDVMNYSDKYVYYKPAGGPATDIPYCLMYPDNCEPNGHPSITDKCTVDGKVVSCQLKDHPNFTPYDPRSPGNIGPPASNTFTKFAKCNCIPGKVGYQCSADKDTYCENGGIAQTADPGCPEPGVVCSCPYMFSGKKCENSVFTDDVINCLMTQGTEKTRWNKPPPVIIDLVNVHNTQRILAVPEGVQVGDKSKITVSQPVVETDAQHRLNTVFSFLIEQAGHDMFVVSAGFANEPIYTEGALTLDKPLGGGKYLVSREGGGGTGRDSNAHVFMFVLYNDGKRTFLAPAVALLTCGETTCSYGPPQYGILDTNEDGWLTFTYSPQPSPSNYAPSANKCIPAQDLAKC